VRLSRRTRHPATPVLVVHPGAELYGSDRMVLETVRGLVTSGTRVVVVLPVEGPLAEALREAGAEVRTMAMPVLRKAALRPAGLLRLLWTSVASIGPTVRVLRSVPGAAVYVSTLTLPSWLLLARATGHRTVCHVHEAERHPSRAVSTALVLPLTLSHRIVVNSRYSGKVLTDVLPRLGRRLTVVYNGVPPHAGGSAPSPELGEGLRVLYIGRISPRKGPDVAARAVRLLHERGEAVSLVVLGSTFPGYEWFEEQLHTEYRDLVEAGVIRFRPFTPDVGAALAQSDVVVVPSVLPEPFGNTAVEAMLAARPVVVSDCGGLPEAVMGHPGAKLVPPGDPLALAEALVHVSRDWATWGRVAREQQAVVADRYDPRRYRREIRSAVLTH
jgi:glycosyltransferase involved in cell wall biosynthesis